MKPTPDSKVPGSVIVAPSPESVPFDPQRLPLLLLTVITGIAVAVAILGPGLVVLLETRTDHRLLDSRIERVENTVQRLIVSSDGSVRFKLTPEEVAQMTTQTTTTPPPTVPPAASTTTQPRGR